jgi:precorrin-6A/cobalt-precorrin-6A reductase
VGPPSVVHVRVLLLGGTGEARALAADLTAAGVDVISSLAGRVSDPALPAGQTRIGGFGGAAGLAAFITDESITAVVDATHPFAGDITANAVAASAQTNRPLLILRRPGWTEQPGDAWTRVADITAAARLAAAGDPGTVFLTTGRRDLVVFADDAAHAYLVRTVDPPTGATPPRMTLLLARGPYVVAAERALMVEHGVTVLVTKDSGGEMTAAKLTAARELGLPVIVVDRPPIPAGPPTVATVESAYGWLAQLSG